MTASTYLLAEQAHATIPPIATGLIVLGIFILLLLITLIIGGSRPSGR